MKATAARDLLEALNSDGSFERTSSSSRDRKLVDALVSVNGEMPTTAVRTAVAKIGQSINASILFEAARKSAPDPAGDIIAKAISKRRDLRAQFFGASGNRVG